MFNRRTFIISSGAVAAGAVALSSKIQAAETRANPSGVRGYDYRLPKFKPGTRLVFQGDSITDMNWGRNEADRNHYLGHSYVYLIASRLGVECAADKHNFFNRGVGSNSMPDLQQRWQKDSIDSKPDLLSVLFGVNDVNRMLAGVTPKDWESDYRALLDASSKANPELKLVLLEPFVLPVGPLANPDTYKNWRGKIDLMTAIVARLAKDFNAVHIKTQAIFDAAAKAAPPDHWIWDGVHPLPQGHELIARNWLEQVSGRWCKL